MEGVVVPVPTKLLLVYSAFPGRRIASGHPASAEEEERGLFLWFQKTPPDSPFSASAGYSQPRDGKAERQGPPSAHPIWARLTFR